MEFIKNRLKSLQYVFQGVYYLVKNEPPVIVHILTSLAWVILGFYFHSSNNPHIDRRPVREQYAWQRPIHYIYAFHIPRPDSYITAVAASLVQAQ